MSAKDHGDDAFRAVENVLGEPAFAEFPQNAWKIRTNLIMASVISVTVALAGLHIDRDSTLLGLKFNGLNDFVFRTGLFWITLYLLLHFIWSAFDSLLEWRLRITGTKVAFVTTGVFSSEHADYPSDPRQSTLYNWWKGEATKIGDIAAKLSEIENQLREWDARLSTRFADQADALNVANASTSISSAREAVVKLERSVLEVRNTISAARIPVSLQRFDGWFQLFLRSQNLRWLIIEFGAPILLGAYALVLLWHLPSA
ncbi:MAG: hypothetical protein HZB40_13410 [Rhodocyclales bacterium]|nr:hypothetical protein [Rhodocyclales bacterium]